VSSFALPCRLDGVSKDGLRRHHGRTIDYIPDWVRERRERYKAPPPPKGHPIRDVLEGAAC